MRDHKRTKERRNKPESHRNDDANFIEGEHRARFRRYYLHPSSKVRVTR